MERKPKHARKKNAYKVRKIHNVFSKPIIHPYGEIHKILMYHLVADMEFKKKTKTYCDPLVENYGNHTTLKSAQSACSLDKNCRAVNDDRCDGKDEFKLCPNSSLTTFKESQSSCVYEKL